MPEDGDDAYSILREEFFKVCKRVLKKELTANVEKHREYLKDLAAAYNDIVQFVSEFYDSLLPGDQETFLSDSTVFRSKLQAVYNRLNVTLKPPADSFSLLSAKNILENFNSNQSSSNIDNMAATPDEKLKFIQAASQTINRPFGGDPLALAAFVNSVKLLKEITAANLQQTLLSFILTRLEGKALECVPRNAADVDEIIAALETNIQPDNSKVVAGRLLALKPDRAKLASFSEQAESLAESFQRSLIIEGISQAKAREMSIEKTVEVCRNAARTELVKAVLASTKFDSPKEVIAKYIVESSTEEKERQILALRAYQRQNRRGNGSTFGNYRGRNGNNRNQGNRYNSNNRNSNNGNANRNSGYGGQGNGDGYRGYNGGSGNFGRNRGYNNYRNNQNSDNRNGGGNRNVRYTENFQAPQVPLGDANNQN